MTLVLILISLALAILFTLVTHPLSLGLILLAQTLNTVIIAGTLNLSFWFSYMLFMVMLGGMLVLLMYMTSVASNEKFSFSSLIPIFILSLIKASILSLFVDKFTLMYENLHKNLMNYPLFEEISNTLSKYLNSPMMTILALIVLFMLVTLIVVVYITKSKQGPLRQKT